MNSKSPFSQNRSEAFRRKQSAEAELALMAGAIMADADSSFAAIAPHGERAGERLRQAAVAEAAEVARAASSAVASNVIDLASGSSVTTPVDAARAAVTLAFKPVRQGDLELAA